MGGYRVQASATSSENLSWEDCADERKSESLSGFSFAEIELFHSLLGFSITRIKVQDDVELLPRIVVIAGACILFSHTQQDRDVFLRHATVFRHFLRLRMGEGLRRGPTDWWLGWFGRGRDCLRRLSSHGWFGRGGRLHLLRGWLLTHG